MTTHKERAVGTGTYYWSNPLSVSLSSSYTTNNSINVKSLFSDFYTDGIPDSEIPFGSMDDY